MSESKLTAALIQFHKDVDKIDKTARGNYGKFADLSNVLSTVTPALLKNDLVLTQTFLANSLVTTLRHVSGEEISSTCDLVLSEGRNKTQEWGKAVTYQRRYSIVSLLGLVADMDMDGAMLEETPAAPAKPSKPAADDKPLTKEDYDKIIESLGKIHAETPAKLKQVAASFKAQFPETGDAPLSQSITTEAHVAFINGLI